MRKFVDQVYIRISYRKERKERKKKKGKRGARIFVVGERRVFYGGGK